MKRVISLLLTTVMILMLIPVNVFAAEQVATLEVTSSKDNAQRGEEVVFTVSLKATDVVSAIGVSVKLPEGLTYTSYSMDKESLVEKTGADVAIGRIRLFGSSAESYNEYADALAKQEKIYTFDKLRK